MRLLLLWDCFEILDLYFSWLSMLSATLTEGRSRPKARDRSQSMDFPMHIFVRIIPMRKALTNFA